MKFEICFKYGYSVFWIEETPALNVCWNVNFFTIIFNNNHQKLFTIIKKEIMQLKFWLFFLFSEVGEIFVSGKIGGKNTT